MSPAAVEDQQTQILSEAMGQVDPLGVDFMTYIQAALAEIKVVSPAVIHHASSLRWSARAVASYRICSESEVHEDRLYYLYLGEHYREAALAHAAMGEPWEPLYAAIDEIMHLDRTQAFDETLTTGTQLKIPRPRRQTMKSGKAAMDSGKAAMDSGRAAMDSGKAAMNSGKAAMNSGQAAMDSGKAAMNSGRAAMNSGKATQNSG